VSYSQWYLVGELPVIGLGLLLTVIVMVSRISH